VKTRLGSVQNVPRAANEPIEILWGARGHVRHDQYASPYSNDPLAPILTEIIYPFTISSTPHHLPLLPPLLRVHFYLLVVPPSLPYPYFFPLFNSLVPLSLQSLPTHALSSLLPPPPFVFRFSHRPTIFSTVPSLNHSPLPSLYSLFLF